MKLVFIWNEVGAKFHFIPHRDIHLSQHNLFKILWFTHSLQWQVCHVCICFWTLFCSIRPHVYPMPYYFNYGTFIINLGIGRASLPYFSSSNMSCFFINLFHIKVKNKFVTFLYKHKNTGRKFDYNCFESRHQFSMNMYICPFLKISSILHNVLTVFCTSFITFIAKYLIFFMLL